MKIIAVGDNCIDNYVKQHEKYAGGCSVNFSVYIRQLGIESAYLGAVGDDENGSFLLETIRSMGVDVSHTHTLYGKTAVTQVELVNQDRHFIGYEEGVLNQFKLQEEDMAYIQEFDYLHTSVYGKIEQYLPEINNKTKICFDFAGKYEYPKLDFILDSIDFAFFSYHQDDDYIRSFLRSAYGHGLTYSIATLGENGSIAYDGNRYYTQGIGKVPVVDTIGAGDSFIAGFMYGVSQGKSLPECLESGAQKAEETIKHFGAF